MITMGNDEFILYIRKRNPNPPRSNRDMGQRIWEWIQENDPEADYIRRPDGEPLVRDCLWGDGAPSDLPKTAHQFRFRRELLPALYTRLDELAEG